MEPRIHKIVIPVASLCFSLILSEVVLRFFVPIAYFKPAEPIHEDLRWTLIHRRSQIPGLPFELKPNVEQFAQGALVRTNSYGMRDRERSMKKGEGVFRIAVLGDSYTFGQGVANEEAYPSVLEKLLNDSRAGYNYEVLNFGVAGYSTRDEALVLRHKAIQWDPDLILVCYVGNDPENDPIQPLHAYFHDPSWWQHSAVLRLLVKVKNKLDILYYGGGSYVRYLHNDPPKWRTVLDAFGDMREIAGKKNIKVVVVIFTFGRDVYAKVWSAAADFGFIPVGLLDAFSAYPRSETRLPDTHPNKFGHRIAAEVIRDALIKQQLVPVN